MIGRDLFWWLSVFGWAVLILAIATIVGFSVGQQIRERRYWETNACVLQSETTNVYLPPPPHRAMPTAETP